MATLLSHTSKLGTGASSAINTTNATLLYYVVDSFGGALTTDFSDSAGNTWTHIPTGAGGGGIDVDLFVVFGPTTSATHTANFATAGRFNINFFGAFSGTTATFRGVYSTITTYAANDIVINPSDLLMYASLVGSNTNNQPDTHPTQWRLMSIAAGSASTTTIQAGSLTPPANNALLLSAVVVDSVGGTYSIDSSFNIIDQTAWVTGVNEGGGVAYFNQSSAAAINPKWANNGAANPMGAVNLWIFGTAVTNTDPPFNTEIDLPRGYRPDIVMV